MGRVFFNTREHIDSTSCTGTTTYEMLESDSGKTFLVSGGAQAITLLPAADLVEGIKEDDIIHYDKHAGHGIQHKDTFYGVIKQQDVVLID